MRRICSRSTGKISGRSRPSTTPIWRSAQPEPLFSFYDEQAPIYTRSRYLPPTKLLDAQVRESMLSEGCF